MSAHRHLLASVTTLVLLASCASGAPEHADLLEAGEDCVNNDQCASGHCDTSVATRIQGHAGLCCAGETCCLSPSDCPDDFRAASQCSGTGCQGTRRDATCLGFVCGSETKADDSGCNGGSTDCGAYAPIACTTSTDQLPTCASHCATKTDCADGYACNASGACVPMAEAGQACTAVAGTTQGTCGDGYKCESGVCCDKTAGACCKTATDCPASYHAASTCSNATSTTDCQGTALEATCNSASVCGSRTIEDDSGCAGLVRSCGVYATVACKSDKAQAAAVCVTTCSSKAGCAAGYTCDGSGACVPEAGAGKTCTAVSGSTAGTCGSGLKCDSGFCCSASSPGSCCTSSSTCTGGVTCSNSTCSCTVNTSTGCASSSNYCVDGTSCTARKAAGATCGAAGQCLSGKCYNSACCTPTACTTATCEKTISDGCGGTITCGQCPCPSGSSRKCGDGRCYTSSQQCP